MLHRVFIITTLIISGLKLYAHYIKNCNLCNIIKVIFQPPCLLEYP